MRLVLFGERRVIFGNHKCRHTVSLLCIIILCVLCGNLEVLGVLVVVYNL
jgi:hypothetical protein